MSAPVFKAAQRVPLPPLCRAVLKQLAWYASDDGSNAYPAVSTICAETGISRRSVQRFLRELEQLGLIVAETPKTGGYDARTHYRIVLDRLSSATVTPLFKNRGKSADSVRKSEKSSATVTPQSSATVSDSSATVSSSSVTVAPKQYEKYEQDLKTTVVEAAPPSPLIVEMSKPADAARERLPLDNDNDLRRRKAQLDQQAQMLIDRTRMAAKGIGG